jgi:hypothetical protein
MKGDSVPYHSELKKYQRNSDIEKISSLGMAIVCEIGVQKTREGIEEYLFRCTGGE